MVVANHGLFPPVWLLEELGLQYEVKVWLRENMMAPAGLKKIHPLGKVGSVVIRFVWDEETHAVIALFVSTQAPVIQDHGKAIA